LSSRISELLAYWTSWSLAKKVSKVYLGDILSKAIAAVSMLLLIRSLSVAHYARYTAFNSVLSLAPGLVGNGINLALVRFAAEYFSKNNRRPLTLYSLGFLFETGVYILCLAILMVFSSPASRLLFGNAKFELPFQCGLMAGCGMLWLQAGRSVYQAEERFSVYVGADLFRQLLVGIALVLLFLGDGLSFHNAALSVVSASLIAGTVVTYDVFRSIDWKRVRIFLNTEEDLLKDFVDSTKWLIAYAVILVVSGQMGVFLLSYLSTEEQVALYGVAFRYYSMILLLLNSIHAVLLPRFSKADMLDTQRQRRFASKWVKNSVWLFVPLSAFALLGKPLFVWVNGAQYGGAFGILVVFLLGSWLSLMLSPVVNVLMGRKHFKYLFVASAIASVVGFGGCYILVPFWGAVGAAISTVVSASLINVLAMFEVR
jgi:O-antigen/teichoic acid export membrane protein